MKRLFNLILILVCVRSFSADKASITIPSEHDVTEAKFTLGDIASFKATAEMINKLSAIELGMSPLPGLHLNYTRSSVNIHLRQHGINPETLTMNVPEKFVITRSAQNVEGAKVEAAAMEALKKQFPEAAETVKLKTPPHVLPVLPGEFHCVADPNIERSGSSYKVTVRITQKDQQAASYDLIYTAPSITAAAILIKPGMPIKVECDYGSIVITVTGEAKTAGAMGSKIQVYLPGTKRMITAIVAGDLLATMSEEMLP